eukprot:scaffold48664_cov42-Phaeocystis_antarctica.AAC.1
MEHATRPTQARWAATRRKRVRVPALAHEHPPCDGRSIKCIGDAFNQSPMNQSPTDDDECSSVLAAAAASTFGVAGGLATAARSAATAGAIAPSCRQPTNRWVLMWLPLALLLAPARADCPQLMVGRKCRDQGTLTSTSNSADASSEEGCRNWCGSRGAGCCYVNTNGGDRECKFHSGGALKTATNKKTT